MQLQPGRSVGFISKWAIYRSCNLLTTLQRWAALYTTFLQLLRLKLKPTLDFNFTTTTFALSRLPYNLSFQTTACAYSLTDLISGYG